jgi:hypothetical protein
MTGNLRRKLFSLFTGALLGYFWGWILGWSLFDPNSDLWALLAGMGAIVGLVIGATPFVWRFMGELALASIGLYLSWIMRTLLFGDHPGGWGVLVLILGSVVSWIAGARLSHPNSAKQKIIPGLVGGLYAGFFGGFLIDVILLDEILGLVHSHSILSQAPAVMVCGITGGVMVARWRSRASQPT